MMCSNVRGDLARVLRSGGSAQVEPFMMRMLQAVKRGSHLRRVLCSALVLTGTTLNAQRASAPDTVAIQDSSARADSIAARSQRSVELPLRVDHDLPAEMHLAPGKSFLMRVTIENVGKDPLARRKEASTNPQVGQ
jgi:hypothetical protein